MRLVVRREHCPRGAKRLQRDVFGAISIAICTWQSNENIAIFIFPYPITSKIFTAIIPWSTEEQLCIFTNMDRNLSNVASVTCTKRLEVIIRALFWPIQTCFVPLELKGCVSRSRIPLAVHNNYMQIAGLQQTKPPSIINFPWPNCNQNA